MVLYDIAAYFESISWPLLRSRAQETGFPMPLLGVALALYAAERHVSAEGHVATARRPPEAIRRGGA